MMPDEFEPVELALLVPQWQVAALGNLARTRGENIGQLLRRVIMNLTREAMPAGVAATSK
jgi:hypothetical protein